MKITSLNNDLVKETAKLLQTKYRRESGLFLIEGEKGLQEAINADIEIIRVFVSDRFLCGSDKFQVIETTDAVLAKISDAKSAPKVVAVAKQPVYTFDSLKDVNRVILLEGIKDAGNLGTILRTASAFSIDAVVLYGDTVDLYNPKCVRSTVGNLWKTPVVNISEFKDLEMIFADYERVATLPKGEDVVDLNKYLPAKKSLIMFGSEADGLSEDLKKFATKNLTIEMSPNVESLNLSVSVAVIAYKLFV